MSYTAQQTMGFRLTVSNGAPASLVLQVIPPDSAPATAASALAAGAEFLIEDIGGGEQAPILQFTLGVNANFVDKGGGVFEYEFVPDDTQDGPWKYRFFGVDSTGKSFSAPSTGKRWRLHIVS